MSISICMESLYVNIYLYGESVCQYCMENLYANIYIYMSHISAVQLIHQLYTVTDTIYIYILYRVDVYIQLMYQLYGNEEEE